jgi:hypothetical protein
MNDYLSGKVEGDRKGEFDEPALCLVLAQENYNIEFLDPKWNVWGNDITIQNNISYDIKDCYFKQSHIDWCPYEANPKIS